jgi:hypothetical protein
MFKNLLCRIGLGSWLIEYCGFCGVRQPLAWWVEDDIYKKVDPDNRTPCPSCFDKRATKLGLFLRWYPKDESERVLSA